MPTDLMPGVPESLRPYFHHLRNFQPDLSDYSEVTSPRRVSDARPLSSEELTTDKDMFIHQQKVGFLGTILRDFEREITLHTSGWKPPTEVYRITYENHEPLGSMTNENITDAEVATHKKKYVEDAKIKYIQEKVREHNTQLAQKLQGGSPEYSKKTVKFTG